MDLIKKDKENVNEVRKKEVEKKLTFINRITPHKNHIIYKFNLNQKTLERCVFTEQSKEIHWQKALEKDYKNKNKKVIVEDNYIYFNALNKCNAIKILKRDYNIIYKQL
jgi:hypothetical protein